MEELLTAEEVAPMLRSQAVLVRHFVRTGALAGFVLPDDQVLIEPKAVEEFLEKCRTGGNDDDF